MPFLSSGIWAAEPMVAAESTAVVAAGAAAAGYIITQSTDPMTLGMWAGVGALSYQLSEWPRNMNFGTTYQPLRAATIVAVNAGYGYWTTNGDPMQTAIAGGLPLLGFMGLNALKYGHWLG